MIKLPSEDIKRRILSAASISEEELRSKVQAKTAELSGLVSEEGALHILAHELKIPLFEDREYKIKELDEGIKNVELTAKVVQRYDLKTFESKGRNGKLASMVVADESGTIRVVLWGELAEEINKININDIVKLSSGYIRKSMNGLLELHIGDRGQITINPEGINMDSVSSSSARPSAERKKISDLAGGETNIELLGTIVQIFDINFFSQCPSCGKKMIPSEDKYICQEHGEGTPKISFVLNMVVDDGTGQMRVALWRNQITHLLGKSEEEIVQFKDDSGFTPIKEDLLGSIIKIVGKVNKNEFFDRIEMNAQLVFLNPDPDEELSRLKKDDVPNTPAL